MISSPVTLTNYCPRESTIVKVISLVVPSKPSLINAGLAVSPWTPRMLQDAKLELQDRTLPSDQRIAKTNRLVLQRNMVFRASVCQSVWTSVMLANLKPHPVSVVICAPQALEDVAQAVCDAINTSLFDGFVTTHTNPYVYDLMIAHMPQTMRGIVKPLPPKQRRSLFSRLIACFKRS